MEFEVDWGQSGRTLLNAGDIWVIPAGQRCSALVRGDTMSYCQIAIPDRAIDTTPLVPRINHWDPLIHQLVEKLHTVARLLKDSAAETFRLLVADSYSAAPPRRKERCRRTLYAATRSLVVAYLEDGLDSQITLESLARLADMSVSNFITAFRAAFHTTPYQFLLDRRIDRAKTLLLATKQSITDIGTSVGFSTPNHFATAFRRRVGVSPREYRASR
ncbi:helix-turn-helix transcriptional regulator [Mycobacterium hubeiense]|uniref:helix-turn-helix transcriptional regulator n=1 Tax=Mycobacterium hubeiense TaxID=1867256 RepID=UPI0027D293F9|nr:helix-turn-helix transcriptional regulator [Mycobacterium sp. QGD 101]